MDTGLIQKLFFGGQLIVLAMLGLIALFFGMRNNQSSFRVRESDKRRGPRVKQHPLLGAADPDLGKSKIKKKSPLLLTGIQTNGEPHIILGIAPEATEKEILLAFRKQMKSYHPDKVGRQGSREWADAQAIAQALNDAKNEMLARLKKSGSRGRATG